MESRYQPEEREARSGRTGLCLSGGGFRAALFHMGALRRLNEVGLLAKVDTISSVSGGSIAAAALAKAWPSLRSNSGVFTNLGETFEASLRGFCARDVRTGPLLTERLDPRNWIQLASDDHSATDFLAHAYRDHLLGDLRLRDLSDIEKTGGPRFVFDAANLQTGVNFEFRGDRIGDYRIGHGSAPDFLVADAVAASSSFPLAFPPFVVKFEPGLFRDGRLEGELEPSDLDELRRRVVLTDGGVYDNLGLEPIWKSHGVVLCSDGGKPLPVAVDPGASLIPRLIRSNDVIMNQVDAVRKRWLISSYERKVYGGAYWGIGSEIEGYHEHRDGYGGDVLRRLRAVRTDIDAFSEDEQSVLANHGWALADAAIRSFLQELVPKPADGEPFSRALLEPGAALAALAKSDRHSVLGQRV